jgi:Tol biopolymer transport system component
MPDVQEVFRMSTQKVRQEPGAMDRQHTRQRKAARNRKLGTFAVVGCIGAALTVAVLVASGQRDEPATSVATQPGGTEQTLRIVDVGSGAGTAFTAPMGAGEFDFTLDGSMLTYSDLDENGITQVFVMAADGSNVRQVTHGEAEATDPEWSFDGSMIAFVEATGETSEIFTVRLSDGVSAGVTREPNEVFDPNWTPDGRSIVFATPKPETFGHVVTMSVDLATGRTRTIVTDGDRPALSPDGTLIVFESFLKQDVRLMLANSDGSERRVIARLPNARSSIDGNGFAEWSPDSTRVAFNGSSLPSGDRPGTYVYDVASGERRFVTARMIEGWVDDEHVLVS